MKLEAAIQSALEFENRIRDLYIEAVARTDEPAGKKIFQTLADDEQRHVDYLENRLDEWQKRGKISNEILASMVPDKAAIRKEAAALQSKISEDARGLKQQMLSQALAMEIENGRFEREIKLSGVVDPEQVEARHENGFFWSILPFAETDQASEP